MSCDLSHLTGHGPHHRSAAQHECPWPASGRAVSAPSCRVGSTAVSGGAAFTLPDNPSTCTCTATCLAGEQSKSLAMRPEFQFGRSPSSSRGSWPRGPIALPVNVF